MIESCFGATCTGMLTCRTDERRTKQKKEKLKVMDEMRCCERGTG